MNGERIIWESGDDTKIRLDSLQYPLSTCFLRCSKAETAMGSNRSTWSKPTSSALTLPPADNLLAARGQVVSDSYAQLVLHGIRVRTHRAYRISRDQQIRFMHIKGREKGLGYARRRKAFACSWIDASL